MKYALHTFAAVLTVLALTLSGCTGEAERAASAPIAVRTVQPEQRDMHEKLEYLGSVHSETEIQINAQLQGSVAAVAVDEGDAVRKGARLLRLFVPDLEAGVERLRAERDYWCRRSEADERLLEQQAIASDQADAGRRACAGAEAALKEAVSRMDKAVEHAPVSGMVLRRFVEAGQNVMPGQPLLLVGSAEKIVQVSVVEEDLARGIRVGLKALLVIDARTRVPARVIEIAPVTASASRAFTVKVRPEHGAKIESRHGSSLSVLFVLAERDSVLTVPTHALVDRATDAAVFLVRGDRAFRQSVRLGVEEDGWVEAAFPWNGTDAVATSNLGSLSDSTQVLAVPQQEVKR
jgi:RND family efflux transporter MFP subunit